MGDSEDENYVKFGTALDPLDEDNLPRKKPVTIEDQYACDEQGRRRFHGAFTGGFSAGYFNTVGTRDGWRPQQFKSSRSSKAENKTQRPQDFMDDEDTGQFGIAPTAIRATADYTDHDTRGTKRERTKYAGDGPIPGTPVLRELLKPVKDTVGVKLLKQMGWKPGQGVGPRLSRKEKSKVKQQNDKMKIYGCPRPPGQEELMETDSAGSDDDDGGITFAPDDYEPFRCNPKDNFFGIGYSGLDKRPILSQHISLFEPAAFKLQDKNKKLSIRGQAFGVGAFEVEDEDIYSREDMSQYDFSLEFKGKQKSRWAKEEKAGASRDECLEGFVPAKNNQEMRKVFKLPDLPKGFKPIHVVRKSRFEPKIESTSLEDARRKGLARHDLRAEDRARIINDPNPIALIISNKTKSGPDRIEKHPHVTDDDKVQSNDEDRQLTSKKPSVISNIITKTLNLHGREQAARNQEQSLNTLRNNAAELVAQGSTSAKNSWLEKLSVKNFVKGDTENLDINNEPTDSPESLSGLKNSTTSIEMQEACVTHEADDRSSSFKPFVANPDKQKRYEQFLELSKLGEKGKLSSIQPLSMTEWERDHERVEFEQAARLYKPLTGSMGDRFVSGKNQDDLNPLASVPKTKDSDSQLRDAAKKKMFGKLTRQRIDWQPASIVCKRFNIAEPRTGCLKQETDNKKTKFSVFDYLEESVHNSSTFQSATDMAVRIKSENSNRTSYQSSCRSSVDRLTNNSAMLMCDNADLDKISARERNFEDKYERIFGKIVDVLEKATEDVSEKVLSCVQSTSVPADIEKVCSQRNLEDIGDTVVSGSKSDNETVETGEILVNRIAEKKDLFKAIFLSSSEDSESEKEEELDDEKLKSVLIGKNPAELNVQRNSSPPRGIFANLDLDSLNDTSVTDSEIKFVSKSLNSKTDEKVNEKAPGSDKNNKNCEIMEDSVNLCEIKTEPDLEILPDMYGPVLPAKQQKNNDNEVPAGTSREPQNQKHVFKSVVVPVENFTPSPQGEWIEKKKDKKLKKEKKKHKHKDHKKHRHKKHKR